MESSIKLATNVSQIKFVNNLMYDKWLCNCICFIVLGLFLRNLSVNLTFLPEIMISNISILLRIMILFPLVMSLMAFINRIEMKHIAVIFWKDLVKARP